MVSTSYNRQMVAQSLNREYTTSPFVRRCVQYGELFMIIGTGRAAGNVFVGRDQPAMEIYLGANDLKARAMRKFGNFYILGGLLCFQ
jgi:hypothetical protein